MPQTPVYMDSHFHNTRGEGAYNDPSCITKVDQTIEVPNEHNLKGITIMDFKTMNFTKQFKICKTVFVVKY